MTILKITKNKIFTEDEMDILEEYSKYLNGIINLTLNGRSCRYHDVVFSINTFDTNNKFLDSFYYKNSFNYKKGNTNVLNISKKNDEDDEYEIYINTNRLNKNIQKITLSFGGTVCNFDDFLLRIKTDNTEDFKYIFKNEKESVYKLILGEFYKYDKGWRFFPTFEYFK